MSQAIEQKADQLAYYASKVVIDNTLWTYFGYKRRPRKGYLSSLFKSKRELNRIDFLSREFFIYLLAVEFKKHPTDIDQDVLQYIYMNFFLRPSKEDLSNAFGFKNKTELIIYFQKGLCEYDHSEYEAFGQILFKRFHSILGNDFKSEWLVGIARLTVHFEGW